MRIHKITAQAAASLAGLAAVSGVAHADNVDYGALEELFNEPVTTSATGAPQRTTDAPVNMFIITQEDIQQSGATDLPGVLERYAVVDVMRSFSGQADVAVRGYNAALSPRLLVLVNGRQVYLDHYGMTNWDTIPVEFSEIRQIEVVVGPNTALFGFNAVGGVVNIITYDAMRDDVDSAQLTAGSLDGSLNGSMVLSGRFGDRIGVRVSAGVSEADATDSDLSAEPTARNPSSHNGAVNVGVQFTDRIRGDFDATYSRDEDTEMVPGGSVFPHNYDTSSYRARISAETGAGLVEGQIYQNNLSISAGPLLGFDNSILVGSLGLVAKPAPEHTLRLAGEYRRNEMSQGLGFSIAYDVMAASTMWNWQVSERLAVTTAVRLDHLELEREGVVLDPNYPNTNSDFDQDFMEVSYNVGGVYRVGANDALRVSVARGVQSPSLIEYGMMLLAPTGPTSSVLVTGNPFIDPTIVQNYELGWDHNLPSIEGALRVSLYYQTNEDLKTLQVNQSLLSLVPTVAWADADNVGDSDLWGIDVGIRGSQGRINWALQYSHRNVTDNIDVPLAAVQTGYDQSSPNNVVTGNVIWVGDAWEAGADVRYVDETSQYLPGSAPFSFADVDSYVLFNARLAWHLSEHADIELIGRNLLEEETETTTRAAVERAYYLRLSANF